MKLERISLQKKKKFRIIKRKIIYKLISKTEEKRNKELFKNGKHTNSGENECAMSWKWWAMPVS